MKVGLWTVDHPLFEALIEKTGEDKILWVVGREEINTKLPIPNVANIYVRLGSTNIEFSDGRSTFFDGENHMALRTVLCEKYGDIWEKEGEIIEKQMEEITEQLQQI